MPNNLFSVRDFSYAYLLDGFIITIVTDVPCHLYMRWTLNPPKLHSMPVLRRGLYLHGDVYFCFTSYHDNEQEEAGDTLTHTFIKHNWPFCQRRWFYFYGTIGGVYSKSTSPYFHLHFNLESMAFTGTSSNRTIRQTSVNWDSAHDAASGTIMDNYIPPWSLIFAGTELTASFWIYRGFLFFDTPTLPPLATPQLATLSLHTFWVSANYLPYTNIKITQGVQADPVIPTNYGDQLPYTTVLGEADLLTFLTGQYNHIPFNSAGIPFITKTAPSRFCLRGQMDIEDIPSIAVYANYLRFHSRQQGYNFAPLLTVYYNLKPPTQAP